MMTSTWLCALWSVLAGAHPAGSVVLGVSRVDGVETEIVVVTPAGEREIVGTLAHARGHVPKGTVDGERLLTTSRVPDDAGGVLEETHLTSGTRRVLATGVLATHAPTVDEQSRVLAVRQLGERSFAVVRIDPSGPLEVARVSASWLTPVRAAPGAFFVVDGARSRIATEGARGLVTHTLLGEPRLRSPAVARGGVLVERALPGRRAELVVAGTKRAVREGLAGMDPTSCGELIAIGAGEKRAGIVVGALVGGAFEERLRIAADRAGVASPRACAHVSGTPVVVAWLDRGAALPGELWRFAERDTSPIVDVSPGTAVEVYGIVTLETIEMNAGAP